MWRVSFNPCKSWWPTIAEPSPPLVPSRQCRAQVGAPVRVLGARGFGERVAMRIGAFEAAEIGAVALADAGYEERHVCLLGVHRRHAGSRQDRRDENTCRRNSRKA